MKVNIVAIIKNEESYIEEWISYHQLKGINHFYIYNNESTDNTEKILKQYDEVGIVTYKNWPTVPQVQKNAYQDFIDNHKYMQEWCAFIDCDEFLVSPFQIPIAIQNIAVMGENLNNNPVGCIVSNWVFFGSNEHISKPKGMVLENFIRSQNHYDQHVKSIILPGCSNGPGNDPHSFKVNDDYITITSTGRQTVKRYPIHPVWSDEIPLLYIAHFHTKSQEEYRAKCVKGRADNGQTRNFEESFGPHNRNEIENKALLAYVDQIKGIISV